MNDGQSPHVSKDDLKPISNLVGETVTERIHSNISSASDGASLVIGKAKYNGRNRSDIQINGKVFSTTTEVEPVGSRPTVVIRASVFLGDLVISIRGAGIQQVNVGITDCLVMGKPTIKISNESTVRRPQPDHIDLNHVIAGEMEVVGANRTTSSVKNLIANSVTYSQWNTRKQNFELGRLRPMASSVFVQLGCVQDGPILVTLEGGVENLSVRTFCPLVLNSIMCPLRRLEITNTEIVSMAAASTHKRPIDENKGILHLRSITSSPNGIEYSILDLSKWFGTLSFHDVDFSSLDKGTIGDIEWSETTLDGVRWPNRLELSDSHARVRKRPSEKQNFYSRLRRKATETGDFENTLRFHAKASFWQLNAMLASRPERWNKRFSWWSDLTILRFSYFTNNFGTNWMWGVGWLLLVELVLFVSIRAIDGIPPLTFDGQFFLFLNPTHNLADFVDHIGFLSQFLDFWARLAIPILGFQILTAARKFRLK